MYKQKLDELQNQSQVIIEIKWRHQEIRRVHQTNYLHNKRMFFNPLLDYRIHCLYLSQLIYYSLNIVYFILI